MKPNGTRRYRVLVVDDVAAVRRLVRLAIEESGRFQVEGEAANGREAVELAGQVRPDLIVLDLSMPGMDGLDALPLLQRAAPQARTVIHTGFEHEALARIAVERGAHAYVEKGVPDEGLVRRLLTVLEDRSIPPIAPTPQKTAARRKPHAAQD